MIQLNTPIFLNVELSRSFVLEYPVCSSEKNIVLPYPITDPDLLSGKAAGAVGAVGAVGTVALREPHKEPKRDKLLFYQGGMHGSCEHIRVALQEVMADKSVASARGERTRETGFATARYCPIPVGDSPSSKRMYDVLQVRPSSLAPFVLLCALACLVAPLSDIVSRRIPSYPVLSMVACQCCYLTMLCTHSLRS